MGNRAEMEAEMSSRLAAADQRLFGDETFKRANPQMKLQMCLMTTHQVLSALLVRPSEELEIEAACATEKLRECTTQFVGTYKSAEIEGRADHVLFHWPQRRQ